MIDSKETKRAVIARCPDCLTFGGPMSLEDRVCGNCGKENCRIYQEYFPGDIVVGQISINPSFLTRLIEVASEVGKYRK